MNARFVNVKVDREERPDIDAVYMAAVQAMTGHGGWPMTVFLTPDGAPFFAGTYFPPVPRHGTASFPQILVAVSEAWTDRREAVVEAGADAVARLVAMQQPAGNSEALDGATLDQAARLLVRSFDAANGGFGHAPKFPPSMSLEHLLRHHARTGDADSLFVAERTLVAMAQGGLYDQLSGGFARYSVDAHWVVPHFEKMLYDNALLLGAYVTASTMSDNPLHARVASETADFLLAELRTADGAFASSLDADTEGVEGRYYVWTPDELVAVLGELDGRWAADVFTVTPGGTFEHGASVLQRRAEPDDLARFDRVRAALAEARKSRTAPGRDDKVVAAWNGLAIQSLARAGLLLERDDLLAAAVEAATLLADVHVSRTSEGVRLRRVSRDGVAGRHAGVLEDYGCVAGGMLALFAATGEPRWFDLARGLLDTAMHDFVDDEGRFVDTSRHAERLITRPADASDNASPSGTSSFAAACIALAALTGEASYRDAADRALSACAPIAQTSPRFAGWALAAAEALVDGPIQVAVVGALDDQRSKALVRAALGAVKPGIVVAWGSGEAAAGGPALLEHRTAIEGAPTAYPCRGFVCHLPVSTTGALAHALEEMK
jgi:uncharacterized protein YyaL (SSP411 family)